MNISSPKEIQGIWRRTRAVHCSPAARPKWFASSRHEASAGPALGQAADEFGLNDVGWEVGTMDLEVNAPMLLTCSCSSEGCDIVWDYLESCEEQDPRVPVTTLINNLNPSSLLELFDLLFFSLNNCQHCEVSLIHWLLLKQGNFCFEWKLEHGGSQKEKLKGHVSPWSICTLGL